MATQTEQKMVTFTPESLARFKNHYEQTVTLKNQQFDFEGNVYVVEYAKYLIQFLEGKMRPRS